MVKVAVTGVAGRMGRALVQAVHQHSISDSDSTSDPGLVLSAAVHKADSELLGMDIGNLCGIGALNIAVIPSLDEAEFDLLLDFTQPAYSIENAKHCAERGKSIVIGTTGFTDSAKAEIEQYARHIPVVLAANTSVGMNLCFHLLKTMAPIMAAESDIEIIETHHRHKVDAPSGTALKLGEVIADSLGRSLQEVAVYGRQGIGEPRDRETIGFATIRGGDVAGDHTVLFASEGERLELTHKASSRMTFAKGAVRAASWLSTQPPGFYDMQDVLGLRG